MCGVRSIVLGGIAWLAVMVGGLVVEGDERASSPAHSVYLPTVHPDRIILTLVDDPATSMAVTWRTAVDVAEGWAELTRATGEPLAGAMVQRFRAVTQLLETDLSKAHYHTVVFRGLTPATRYAYRVGDGTTWSAWQHFSTAGDNRAPLTFLYFGDAQNDIFSQWSRVVREAFQTAPRAAFLLHAGDLINRWNRDAEWGEWHAAAGWINGTIPTIAAAGNHEYGGTPPFSARLTGNWRAQFEFPANGPEGLDETVYFVDYQVARVVVLDSNLRWQDQADWLKGVLTGHGRPWTIVTFHHPIFPAKPGRVHPMPALYWKPLFDRYRVDLVLQGHDHSYVRSGLVGAGQAVESGSGDHRAAEGSTVYVISVSGPKMYDLGWQPYMRRAARNTQMFQVLHLTEDELRFEARMANGELYDAFLLRKRPGEPNELIDLIPETPDRR